MFDQLVALIDSQPVKEANAFDTLLHKELVLGQTRFVCRYGTLSDGHDKVTDAQRYYQAIREMYSLSNEIESKRILAMEAQADLIEAQEELNHAQSEPSKLRARAKIRRAESQLKSCFVSVKDQLRMVDEYNKVRLELQDKVRTKYPEGIEQAEPDNWMAVGEYWTLKKQMGAHSAPLTHLPLEPDQKAYLGLQNNTPELTAWFLIQNKEKIKLEFQGDIKKFLEATFNHTIEDKR